MSRKSEKLSRKQHTFNRKSRSEVSIKDITAENAANTVKNMLASPTYKHPKSSVMEYCQKFKLTPPKFKHMRFDKTQEFISSAIFCGAEFSAKSKNKKQCEKIICEDILEYLKSSKFTSKVTYKAPENYKSILFIDLENFSSVKFAALAKNYKDYKIVSYLSYAHTFLKTKRMYFKKFTELKIVDSDKKDAVDLQIVIDLARLKPLLKAKKIEKVYLLTGDHFGHAVEELLPYCVLINEPDILLDHNNVILKNN